VLVGVTAAEVDAVAAGMAGTVRVAVGGGLAEAGEDGRGRVARPLACRDGTVTTAGDMATANPALAAQGGASASAPALAHPGAGFTWFAVAGRAAGPGDSATLTR
jgi:hypothetical protein